MRREGARVGDADLGLRRPGRGDGSLAAVAGRVAPYTQTFLGHPPGCAAALASLAVIEEEKLVERSAETGARALARLRARLAGAAGIREVRGRGLLLGIECASPEIAARVCSEALARGVILLLSGDAADVLSITPPLPIGEAALIGALDLVGERLRWAALRRNRLLPCRTLRC